MMVLLLAFGHLMLKWSLSVIENFFALPLVVFNVRPLALNLNAGLAYVVRRWIACGLLVSRWKLVPQVGFELGNDGLVWHLVCPRC